MKYMLTVHILVTIVIALFSIELVKDNQVRLKTNLMRICK